MKLLYKIYIIISLSRKIIPIDAKNLMILLHHLVIAKRDPVGVERGLDEYDERGDIQILSDVSYEYIGIYGCFCSMAVQWGINHILDF
jgi:hypothetical protein